METKPCVFLCFDYSQKWFGRWGQKFKNMLTACVQYAQKNNASLVGYKISCFFIQMMRSNENVTSACQRTMARWAVGPAQASAQLWTLGALRLHLSATVTHTQSQRYCSPSPAHVSVRRNAADGGGGGAQPHASTAASTAGMRQRPNIQRHPRHRPMHSFKGIAPEAPAHVSVRLWAAYGGDRGAKSCALQLLLQLACDVCSRWLVRGVDGARIFAGTWQ